MIFWALFWRKKAFKKENILQAGVKMARLLTFAKLGKIEHFATFFDNVMSIKTEKQ
jgi:hypothetical protein